MKQHTTHRLTVGGLLLSVAVLLPQLLHIAGSSAAGNMVLPMHFPVLLGGLLLGPFYGGVIGAIAPVLSFLLSGMPSVARLPFMVLELLAYGVLVGCLARFGALSKHPTRVYAVLVGAMLGGRLVYAAALWVASALLHIPCGGPIAAVTATVSGGWGIALQLLILPPIWLILRKRGIVDGLSS